jgi:hypothetical protein
MIRLVAFRGTGGFRNPKYRPLPGLIKAGHVGLQLENDPVIYGFHPSPAAETALGSEEALLTKLIAGEAQEGTLQDDTLVFHQAHDLHQQGERTVVWVLILDVAEADFEAIQSSVRAWYNGSKTSRYSLPLRDGSFQPGTYNCATFPKVLGMQLPSENGRLAVYIEAMKAAGATRWSPSPDNS